MMIRPKRPQLSDQARFEEIFDAHNKAVLGYALRRVDVPADAADVLGEVFLVAWRRMDAVPSGDAARWWLLGTAKMVLANHRRGDRRRSSLTTQLELDLARELPQQSSSSTDAEHPGMSDALGSLKDEDREILLLHAWDELRASEIAQVMAMNPATVRTRLHRARRRVAASLRASESSATNENDLRSLRPEEESA